MRILAALLVSAFAAPAQASFHLWYVNEAFSNADGSIQYIELKASAAGQEFVAGHSIRVTQGSTTHSYTLTTNLPGNTADSMGGDGYYGGSTTYKSMLIGTQGFADLHGVTPDYVVPNGFLFVDGGTSEVIACLIRVGLPAASSGPPSGGKPWHEAQMFFTMFSPLARSARAGAVKPA